MKSLSLLFGLLLIPIFGFSNTEALSPDERCRKIAQLDDNILAAKERIYTDLTNGIWTKNDPLGSIKNNPDNSGTGYFQFHSYGLMDYIHTNDAGDPIIQTFSWNLQSFGNVPFLHLLRSDNQTAELYKIEQNCEGIRMTNIESGEAFLLNYSKKTADADLETIRYAMVGDWKSIVYPFDLTNDLNQCGTFEAMKDAYLNYSFSADGTYVKNLGTQNLDIEEHGFWEISDNGKYLLLHVAVGDNPEFVRKTFVAEITHINPGELVLKQSLHIDGDLNTLFCTSNKTFFFNKA